MNIIFIATLIYCLSAVVSGTQETTSPDLCSPLVIAHRGASGYVPEHTLGAYALAITLGSDYVEPDLVLTKDWQLIARHENELSITTDVDQHPEFEHKRQTKLVDGREMTGWFVEDFTLEEIKTLRVNEALGLIRPGNARLNGAFTIPTFQEIIDLAKSMEISQKRIIGICPELKLSSHFNSLGIPMEQLVVDAFHSNGYNGTQAPAMIQSFEVSNLKYLKQLTDLRLLQLYSGKTSQPSDQTLLGTALTYGDMATPEGLKDVASYAYGVGPPKNYILPLDAMNRLDNATSFVADAHEAGLKVYPYTFRAENVFLPSEFQSSGILITAIGDFEGEIRAFLAAGIDGLFVDQPDIPLRIRGVCDKSYISGESNNESNRGERHSSFLVLSVVSLFTYWL